MKAGFSAASDIIEGENMGATMSKNLKKASVDILKKVSNSGSVKRKGKHKKTKNKNSIISFIRQ